MDGGQSENPELQRLLAEASRDLVSLHDSKGAFVYASPASLRLLGFAPEELVGRTVYDLFHPEDLMSTHENFLAQLTSDQQFVVRMQHKERGYRWMEVFVRPLAGPAAALGKVLLASRDVTDTHHLEEQLMERNWQLQQTGAERERTWAHLENAFSVLASTLEATKDGILVVDRDGRVTRFNQSFAQMWQVPDELLATHEELRLRDFMGSLIPDAAAFSTRIDAVDGKPHAESLERIELKDGRVFERASKPQRLGDDIVGRVWSFRDVTVEMRAEAALRESLESFRALAEDAPVGIFHTTPKGVVDYANAQWMAIAGVDFHDDAAIRKAVHPDDFASLSRAWRACLASQTPLVADLRYVHANGDVRYCSSRATPVRNAEGELMGFVGTLADVTESKKVERALRAAKDAAEQAAQAKTDFLANTSHEIRTPMNAVVGVAQLLLDSPLDAKQRELVDTILAGGEHLIAIINDILDFSKIESGKLQLEPIPVALQSAFQECHLLMHARAVEKGLAFHCDIDPTLPAAVLVDPGRLRQVLLNLVSNAIKFTEHGLVHVEVMRGQRQDGRTSLEVAVHDTGIGIPADRMGRLWKPFSQADTSTTRTHGGTGLGLVITERLVRLMGGEVAAESEEGKGSTFRFSIPIEPVALPQPAAKPAATATAPAADGRHPLRVLVVEDNATNQKVAVRMLERLGVEPKLAGNGFEAVAAVHKQPYDVILMDIQMPGMDGVQATRRIHAEMGDHAPRIVAMTAHAMPGDRERYMAEGMDDYISKPVHLETLAAVLAKADACARGVPAA
jgi:PAS domain S-box-containing protein